MLAGIKSAVSLMMTIVLMIGNIVGIVPDKKIKNVTAREAIVVIENELRKNGTDVKGEIKKLGSGVKALAKSPNKVISQNAKKLLTTLDKMLGDYEKFQTGKYNDVKSVVLGAEVTAVAAFFWLMGYSLSAELLVHARMNTKLDSNYYPIFGQRVLMSKTLKNIAKGKKVKGTSSFEKTGNTIEKDLYYSIHGFTFTKPNAKSKVITIRDRYDYAKNSFGGLTGMAVNAMYDAQEQGVIVPYYVTIITAA